jgi:DNA-binding winged helix-turn-helix (wHTH) protein/Flp pilus assembly protein TadD
MSAKIRNSREVYRFGDFSLSMAPLHLRHGTDRVDLQTQPLRLLELLVRRAGQIVTHEDIREELWQGRTISFAGSLHVAIRQIRAALKDDANTPAFIETVPRQGYRFIAHVETGPSRRAEWLMIAASVSLAIVILGISADLARPRAEPASENIRLGEYLLAQHDPAVLDQSLSYFDAEMTTGTNLVRARTGAARAALLMQDYDLAHAHADAALQMDARNADAYEIRAHVALMRDHDGISALPDIARALELAPEHAPAHHSMAVLMMLSGEPEAALAFMREARRLDPASTLIRADLGWMEYLAGQSEAALASCETAFAVRPEMETYRYCVIRAADMSGIQAPALPHINWLMERSEARPEDIDRVLSSENPIRSFEIWRYERYTARDRADAIPAGLLAWSAAAAGRYPEAEQWLEAALGEDDPNIIFAAIDPVFAPLREYDALRALSRDFRAPDLSAYIATDGSALRGRPLR